VFPQKLGFGCVADLRITPSARSVPYSSEIATSVSITCSPFWARFDLPCSFLRVLWKLRCQIALSRGVRCAVSFTWTSCQKDLVTAKNALRVVLRTRIARFRPSCQPIHGSVSTSLFLLRWISDRDVCAEWHWHLSSCGDVAHGA
jgi:hypothetical protein